MLIHLVPNAAGRANPRTRRGIESVVWRCGLGSRGGALVAAREFWFNTWRMKYGRLGMVIQVLLLLTPAYTCLCACEKKPTTTTLLCWQFWHLTSWSGHASLFGRCVNLKKVCSLCVVADRRPIIELFPARCEVGRDQSDGGIRRC